MGKNSKKSKSVVTAIVVAFWMVTIIVMATLYGFHWTEGLSFSNWPTFALLELLFVGVGAFGILAIMHWRMGKDQKETFLHFGYTVIIIVVVQLIAGMLTQLSFTALEQALYFIFAGCSEETFRIFLILLVLGSAGRKAGWARKILAIAISTLWFVAIHVSYYGSVQLMMSVTLGGIALAITFLLWWDLAGNICAHCFVNMSRSMNFLVSLSAAMPAGAALGFGFTPADAIFCVVFAVVIWIVYHAIQSWRRIMPKQTTP